MNDDDDRPIRWCPECGQDTGDLHRPKCSMYPGEVTRHEAVDLPHGVDDAIRIQERLERR